MAIVICDYCTKRVSVDRTGIVTTPYGIRCVQCWQTWGANDRDYATSAFLKKWGVPFGIPQAA